MLSGKDRAVWLQVGSGVEILSGRGASIWNEPAAARVALREMLSAVSATHVQIDLVSLLRRSEPAHSWSALLSRSGDWAELLRETSAAIGDAVRSKAEWGLGLPSPAVVAESLGDASERGMLKAGIQLASFLQGFREAGLGFVALDLTGPVVTDKAVAQVLRNAQLYGWRQAVIVASTAAPAAAEIRLVSGATLDELAVYWSKGELVGGGLDDAFWGGAELAGSAPPRALLYGEIPAAIDAAAIVGAGRRLGGWLG